MRQPVKVGDFRVPRRRGTRPRRRVWTKSTRGRRLAGLASTKIGWRVSSGAGDRFHLRVQPIASHSHLLATLLLGCLLLRSLLRGAFLLGHVHDLLIVRTLAWVRGVKCADGRVGDAATLMTEHPSPCKVVSSSESDGKSLDRNFFKFGPPKSELKADSCHSILQFDC